MKKNLITTFILLAISGLLISCDGNNVMPNNEPSTSDYADCIVPEIVEEVANSPGATTIIPNRSPETDEEVETADCIMPEVN
ncbi:MAG: hypothetical protein KAH84_01915 [Thiomargarita sp.]|nr:hypothetical protein [Thiomargarita sp.]